MKKETDSIALDQAVEFFEERRTSAGKEAKGQRQQAEGKSPERKGKPPKPPTS